LFSFYILKRFHKYYYIKCLHQKDRPKTGRSLILFIIQVIVDLCEFPCSVFTLAAIFNILHLEAHHNVFLFLVITDEPSGFITICFLGYFILSVALFVCTVSVLLLYIFWMIYCDVCT